MRKKLSRRDFLRITALVGSGALAAACSAPSAPTPTSPSAGAGEQEGAAPAENTAEPVSPTTKPPASGEVIDLALWGWWDIRMALYQEAANDYMKENPNTRIKVEVIGDEIEQKFYASAAAGTGPDIMKQAEFLFKMAQEGLVVPYPEDLFPDSWFEENYPNFDHKSYQRLVVPTGESPVVLLYNKSMFEEVGLDPEKPPTTWDELVDYAKKLTIMEGDLIQRSGFIPGIEFTELDFIYQQGGNIVRRDGEKLIATMTTPEVETAYDFTTDLALEHKVWSPDLPDQIQGLGTTVAAMTLSESWVIGEYMANFPEVYKVLGYGLPPTPTGSADPLYGRKSMVLDLSTMKTEPAREKAAFDFLKYFYDQRTDINYRLVELTAIAPSRKELFDDPKVKELPGMDVMLTYLDKLKDPVQPLPQMQDVMDNARNRVLLEGQPVKESLEIANQDFQKLLDEGFITFLQ